MPKRPVWHLHHIPGKDFDHIPRKISDHGLLPIRIIGSFSVFMPPVKVEFVSLPQIKAVMIIHEKADPFRPYNLKFISALSAKGRGRNMKLQVITILNHRQRQLRMGAQRMILAAKTENSDQFSRKIHIEDIDAVFIEYGAFAIMVLRFRQREKHFSVGIMNQAELSALYDPAKPKEFLCFVKISLWVIDAVIPLGGIPGKRTNPPNPLRFNCFHFGFSLFSEIIIISFPESDRRYTSFCIRSYTL